MSVVRNFQPLTYLELITDYAYIVIDDELSTSARKQIKLRLFQAYVPRIYIENIPLLIKESGKQPIRSIILISQNTSIDTAPLSSLDFKIINDDDMNKLLTQIEDLAQSTKTWIQKLFGPLADVYSHRLKLRQVQLATQFYDLLQLATLQSSEISEDISLDHDIQKQLNEQMKIYNCIQRECIKNTFYQNMIAALKQQQQILQSQQINYASTSNFLQVQDFEQLFAPKSLESLECKQTLNNHTLHFLTGKSLSYDPIQLQFPLCDDPTKPWFYINDARITYNTPVDSLPYGRLLIQGNYLKQPSCILQNTALGEGADELSQNYQTFETSIAKACHAVSQLLVSATKHSKRVLSLISDEIKAIQGMDVKDIQLNYQDGDFSLKKSKVYRNTLEEDVDDFIIQNSALLCDIGYNREKLPCYKQYLELKLQDQSQFTYDQKFIMILCDKLQFPDNSKLSKSWIMDFDEMFLVNRTFNGQSPVSLYTQEATIKPTDEDDIITIRPKFIQSQYQLSIQRMNRKRTTYDMIVLLGQFLSLVSQIDPLPKRSYTHRLLFNEKLALKHLFVPHEIAEQCEQERLVLQQNNQNNVKNAITPQNNKQFYDLVVSKVEQISSRDKFAKTRVAEDCNPGDCAVCNVRFDSYKQHIFSSDHKRQYRNIMQQNENMLAELQRYQLRYDIVQALNTQLNAIACTLASEMNISWSQAITAINESIRAVGGQFQLDTEDAPRAGSPTCKSNQFAHWREDQCLRRQSMLENVLTSGQSRKSGYKRIKACAGSFLVCVLGVEKNRVKCIEQFLQDQFSVQQKENTFSKNLIDYMYYEYIDEPNQFEKGQVRIVLKNDPQYWFHQPGYNKLLNIAYITLLCRAAQGMPLTAETKQDQYIDLEETKFQNDAYLLQISNYLSDCFPQIDGVVYQQALTKLQEKRFLQSGPKQSLQQPTASLDVMKLDIKSLKQELADIEIGHIPKTDSIIRIAKTIIQIQEDKQISTQQLYQKAIEQFKSKQLPDIHPRIQPAIQEFVNGNTITDLSTISFKNPENYEESDSCELEVTPYRVKLPQFNIFDPLIKKNDELVQTVIDQLNTEQSKLQNISSAVKQEGVKPGNYPQQFQQILHSPNHRIAEIGVTNSLLECSNTLIQKIFQQASETLQISLSAFVYHTNQEYAGTNTLQTFEPITNDKNYLLDEVKPHILSEVQRANSCVRHEKSPSKVHRSIRANSICTRDCNLDPEQVSLYYLRNADYTPQFTDSLSTVSSPQMVTVGEQSTNIAYSTVLADNYVSANYEQQSTPEALKLNNKPIIASPILSTSSHYQFYRQMLPENFDQLATKQQKMLLRQFIPISESQISAVYATLATVYGGFSQMIEITVQFWKSSADAILGSSSSVHTILHEKHYGLNIADIASVTLIGLTARSKLLQEKAEADKRERKLRIASKQVNRCVPPDGIVDKRIIEDAFSVREEIDVKVVKNEGFADKLNCDIIIGGIYGLNGTE
ncbi:hypothetical protein SS50377_25523 [Spironucleus salmonicida]|uniref:DBF4-type domain-containing protein n=1 Tax=Spironucleus salmonicida TaxID=348837 RepID=V6LMY4_9EUKA|nr:hypothetical protein SS50377_25523 [Spironucleus salmonicida]|eukprot:EST45071.1 hypothetical protein SS50377_15091 [Spironucleus salmonicida]